MPLKYCSNGRIVAARPTEEARIQKPPNVSETRIPAATSRSPLPAIMWPSACDTNKGWRVFRNRASPVVTSSESKYSRTVNKTKAEPAVPKVQRQLTSAKASLGWRTMARNASMVGDGSATMRLSITQCSQARKFAADSHVGRKRPGQVDRDRKKRQSTMC